VALTFYINETGYKLEVAPEESLLYVLRNLLDLTGTKYGCGEGQCGACTILLDGKSTRSCITSAGAAAGKQIITIEGLARGGVLHPVQQAFLQFEAFQCGYCTPGMILSAVSLLQHADELTDEQIVSHMNGNVCRCGTYQRILDAIRAASTVSRIPRNAKS
jgi:aerobic-type carbon monoxide dehydrogenase small subunit (CoxS/CutS family)